MSIKKIEYFFTHLNGTLGFITTSRLMTAFYPYYKWSPLLDLLQSPEWEPKLSHQVRPLSKMLENIRHLDQILLFGNHISIHLQLFLSQFIHMHIRRETYFSSLKRIIRAAWNQHSSVRIRYSVARDLQHLRQLLESCIDLLVSSSQVASTLWANQRPTTSPWEASVPPWSCNGGSPIQS